jgi:serine/threonine protein kinase
VDGVVVGPPGGGSRVVTSSPLAAVRPASFNTSIDADGSPSRSPRSPRSGGIAAHTIRGDKESPVKPRRPAAPTVWKKGIQIGEGSFGRVFRGMNSLTGEFFAVKELPVVPGMHDQDLLITELMREIDVLSSLEHKHIVSYIGTQRSDENLFLFTEYITGALGFVSVAIVGV